MRRRDSAAMVSKTSELLPDPDTPVKTVSSRFGRSTSTSRRLFSPAPRTRIVPQAGASSAVMRGRWYREGRPDRFGARQPPASVFSVSASFLRVASRVRMRSLLPISGVGFGLRGARPDVFAAARASVREACRPEIVAS